MATIGAILPGEPVHEPGIDVECVIDALQFAQLAALRRQHTGTVTSIQLFQTLVIGRRLLCATALAVTITVAISIECTHTLASSATGRGGGSCTDLVIQALSVALQTSQLLKEVHRCGVAFAQLAQQTLLFM